LRLAQRLSGGTEALLRKTCIAIEQRRLVLSIPAKQRELYTDPVARRLNSLAKALDRAGEARFS
jgi:exopolyphosphatase/guanosine-5'-triphosphate,3'-diphosphate pyrophosphatase